MAVLSGPRRRGRCGKLRALLGSEQGWHFFDFAFEVNVKCTFSVEFLAFCLNLLPFPDGLFVFCVLCVPSFLRLVYNRSGFIPHVNIQFLHLIWFSALC